MDLVTVTYDHQKNSNNLFCLLLLLKLMVPGNNPRFIEK